MGKLSWITEIKYDQSIALTSWTQGWITEMISENNATSNLSEIEIFIFVK